MKEDGELPENMWTDADSGKESFLLRVIKPANEERINRTVKLSEKNRNNSTLK